MALVRRGNESAFEELFDRHSGGVLLFCSRMLDSRAEGEDALQHVFLAVYQALGERDVEPQAFKSWLYTIARNRCISVRRSRSEVPLPDEGERFAAVGETADRAEQRAEVRDLLSDLRDLPEPQRVALLLSELGGLTHAQIAQVIACPRKKVKSLVFQARASLSSGREARGTTCSRVREELATSSETGLPIALRRHLKRCEGCREFAIEVRRRRRLMVIGLPLAPSIGLKRNVLAAVGGGGGQGGGGGGLAGGLVAKGASLGGAAGAVSGGTAGGGLSAAVLAKASLVAGATAAMIALGFTGGSGSEKPPQKNEGGRSSSSGAVRSNASERQAVANAVVPDRYDRLRAPELGRLLDGQNKAGPLLAKQAPPPARSSGTRGPANRAGDPRAVHEARGPTSDGGIEGLQIDPNSTEPQRDLGEMTCESRDWLVVDVDRLVYACVFRDPIRSQGPHQRERTCRQRGGLFVEVSPLVYACALPVNRSVPNPFPPLPLPK